MGAAIDWSRIENFLGYGPIDARVVFLGMEEGQSRLNSLAADLGHRSRFDRTMDLKEAHQGIDGTERYFDAGNGATQRTWRPMCHVMIRWQGSGMVANARSRLRYQALHLGRTDGNTLLMELLPYPKRTAHDWPEIYRTRYPSRALYELGLLPQRMGILSRALKRHPRKLIVCYGKGNWRRYKQLANMTFGIDSRGWTPATPSKGAHDALMALAGNTRILLVKHFCCSEFNTEAQLDRLSEAAGITLRRQVR